MPKFWSFILGVVAGAVTAYSAMNFHVIRASDGFHFVAKQPPRMAEAYVDVRGFGMTDWVDHPQLATALAMADKQKLLGDSAIETIHKELQSSMPNWPEQSDKR